MYVFFGRTDNIETDGIIRLIGPVSMLYSIVVVYYYTVPKRQGLFNLKITDNYFFSLSEKNIPLILLFQVAFDSRFPQSGFVDIIVPIISGVMSAMFWLKYKRLNKWRLPTKFMTILTSIFS